MDATRLVDSLLAEHSLGDGKFVFPRKHYKKSRGRIDPDDFDIAVIWRTVYIEQGGEDDRFSEGNSDDGVSR